MIWWILRGANTERVGVEIQLQQYFQPEDAVQINNDSDSCRVELHG